MADCFGFDVCQDLEWNILQHTPSGQFVMAEPPPPETPTGAARALIAWFAGGLAFQSVETWAAGATTSAVQYGIAAVIVAIMDYKLPSLLSRVAPGFTRSLNRVAGNAAWWLASILVVLLFVMLAPYVEQRRVPFIWLMTSSSHPSAQEIASAVAPLVKAELEKTGTPPNPSGTPQDVLGLIASLRAQIETVTHDKAYAERQLDDTRHQLAEARKPPLDPKTIPTWLDLNFDASGAPSETKSTNIHWTAWNGEEPAAGCPSSPLAGPNFGLSLGGLNCIAAATVIFLSFDKAISYQNISITTSQTIPNWEVLQRDAKTALILLHGKIASASMSIAVIK